MESATADWGDLDLLIRMGVDVGEVDARGGDYFGPRGFYEMRGYPKRVDPTDAAKNEDDARRLWQVSEDLTGVSFLSDESSAA